MQGRRDNNEDRAAIENVEMVAGAGTGNTVQLWAVLDGHGGQGTRSVQTCELYLTMSEVWRPEVSNIDIDTARKHNIWRRCVSLLKVPTSI